MPTSGGFNVSIPTPVSVPNGGTGLATIPSGAVVIGNGVSAVTSVAPGSNGDVLVVSAGVWASAPPAAAGAPASGTYIVQVPNGSLPNAQALSALATGLLKSTTATGVLSIATGADLPVHSAALITSGTLALARGGTNTDLSLTGGANQYLKQVTLGGPLTVAGILSADLTTALTTPPAIGGTTPAAITGTTGVFGTSVKTPIIFPSADSTTAIKFNKADGTTNIVTIDTTNSRVGIGITPTVPLEVARNGGTVAVRVTDTSNSNSVTLQNAGGSGSITITTGGTIFQFGQAPSVGYLGTQGNASHLFYSSFTNNPSMIIRKAGSQTADILQFQNSTPTTLSAIDVNGSFGMGTPTPLTPGHVRASDAVTGVADVLTIEHTIAGTPAAGFGANAKFLLKSSTTTQRLAATIKVLWNVETDASRAPDIVITATDANAEREIMRGRANGSAPMVGFLGATPAIQQTGGAATATIAYTATEQSMLQKAYDALRTFGYLS